MHISEYKNMYLNESSHFYYVGFQDIILSLLKKYLFKKSALRILDAGCGTGSLAKKLSSLGMVEGIDISPEALKFAKKRGLTVKKGSVTKIPYPSNTFDVVASIDVICHRSITNGASALKELSRVLKPDGMLVIKVPANPWLYGSHDILTETRKRYTKDGFIRELKRAKLFITKVTYIGSFTLPFAAIRNFWEKLTHQVSPHSSITKTWQPLNQFLIYIFLLERQLLRFFNLPFGISLIAFAKKRRSRLLVSNDFIHGPK